MNKKLINKKSMPRLLKNSLKIIIPVCLLLVAFNASAAENFERYWVNGTGNWSDATNHWATSSLGTPGAANIPTATTSVFFDTNSTTTGNAYTVTMDVTNYAGTTTFVNPASGVITLNRGSAKTWWGYGSITLAPGMILSGGYILYLNTPGGNITTNGVNWNWRTIIVSGTWDLQDAYINSNSSGFGMNTGIFNTNNQSVTVTGPFGGGTSGVKTFNLGTSVITATGSVDFSTANTNVNATSSTFILQGTANFTGGSKNYNIIQLNGTAHTVTNATTTGSITALTRTGTAAKTDSLSFGSNVAINTLTINGASSTSRVLVKSGTAGTVRIIVATTTSMSNADFQDITGAGSGSWNLAAITGLSGDCQGNTGITFTTATTSYWYRDSGNWSSSTAWYATTSPSLVLSRVPLCQDDVVFDTNSFSAASKIVTGDMPRLGKNINYSGVTNTPQYTNGAGRSMFGSLILGTMTWTGGSTYYFEGRGSYTLTTNGVTIGSLIALMAPGGTLTLQDTLVIGDSRDLYVSDGTFDANDQNITISQFVSSYTSTRGIRMGSGTWTLTGGSSGYPWHTSVITNLTFDADSSTIKTTGALTTGNSYFHGGGLTFNNVWIANTGAYAIQFTGSSVFNDLKINPGRTVQFTANTTTTVNTFTSTATALATTSIGSITAAAHRLVKTGGGTISSDYLYISYSNATPTLTWYAGANSTDGGNNTGWIFTAPPSSSVWQPRPGIISPSGGGFLMF